MASVKILMDSIDSIFIPDPSDNSIVIEFKKPDGDDNIHHAIHVADTSWTLVIKDGVLLIEQ